VPPSKRVEYYIEATAAKLGLSKATVEEAPALYRRLERRALAGKSPRVMAAAVIYAAACTPVRAAAEALGVSPISVKATVYKLKLTVKCAAEEASREWRKGPRIKPRTESGMVE